MLCFYNQNTVVSSVTGKSEALPAVLLFALKYVSRLCILVLPTEITVIVRLNGA